MRYRLVIPFLILLLCAAIQANARGIVACAGGGVSAPAGVTIDNVTTATQTTADQSFSHSQGDLTNGVAILIVAWLVNASTSATATYDGNAMTEIESQTGSATKFTIWKYDLGTSSAGNKAVVVDFDDSMYGSHAVLMTFSGAAQSTTYTDGGSSGYTNTRSVTLATSAGSIMVGGISFSTNVTLTGNATEIYKANASAMSSFFQRASGTGGNVTLQFDSSGSFWNAAAAVVVPSAGD